jgi:ubiquitin-protein ligase
MASKMVFMRRRIDLDLQSLLSDPDPQSVTTRTFLGADLGVSCAFLNFRIEPLEGPLRGASIALTLKATANYPYEPPQVYAHDTAFLHPNKDPATNRLMFSFVDPQYWKPIFELRQVLCALDMVLLTPDLGYASLKNLDYIRHVYRKSRDMEEEGRAEAAKGEAGSCCYLRL